MDEVKWYENCTLDSIKNIIKDNINTASRSFVAIGYYLKNVRDRELHLQDGYQSIWEFAQTEFGIGKSSASRFMAINDRFSKDGNSPILLEQYKDFSSSKLSEMLTMSDEQLEQVTLTTTVAEIREIKNPDKVVAMSQQIDIQEQINVKQFDIPTYEKSGEPYGATRSAIIESLVAEMVDADTAIEDIDGDYCPAFGKDYYAYSSNINRYINIEDDNNNVVFRTSFERFQGEYEWHKARLATLSSEEPEDDEEPEAVNNTPEKATEIVESVIEGPKSDNPLSCKHDSEAKCLIASKDSCVCKESESCMYYSYGLEDEEPIEIIEAGIIQFEPTEPTELPNPLYSAEYHLKEAIRQEEEQIEIMQDHWKVHQPDIFLKHQTILRALKCFLSDMEYPDPETEEMEQPEFPKLKNNDQRKEWIDNYTSWPVWIDIPQTGEKYYRYDFDNGTSFVIRVSLQHAYKDYIRTEDIKYAHEEYFLLGVKDKWIPGMPTFVESRTNKSAMVEHLKEIQKKGG
jgi:hypothetical protein